MTSLGTKVPNWKKRYENMKCGKKQLDMIILVDMIVLV